MKILVALNHPAHYYLFKYIVLKLNQNGHDVRYIIKDILQKLMDSEGVSYTKVGVNKRQRRTILSQLIKGSHEIIQQDVELFRFAKTFRPFLMIGTDIAITHVGKILNIPSLVFNEDDYEINKLFCKSAYPFATHIISPDLCSVGKYNHKKIAYHGCQKMAYLNPKYFQPDSQILNELGLGSDPFFLIRLVSLSAGHDIEGKHSGINETLLNKLILSLEEKGRVLITSEGHLSKKLHKYELIIAPNSMHDLMYYASLFIGDSQTMCAEAGILGTPFIRFNDFVGKIGYLNDLENNYKLGTGVKTDEPWRIFSIINKLFKIPDYKKKYKIRKEKLFKDKIDLISFTMWLIENYPQSIRKVKETPDYQYNF